MSTCCPVCILRSWVFLEINRDPNITEDDKHLLARLYPLAEFDCFFVHDAAHGGNDLRIGQVQLGLFGLCFCREDRAFARSNLRLANLR